MAFALTYQDYLNSIGAGTLNGGSEGGQGVFSGIPESDWSKLTDAQKWNAVGGSLMLAPSDTRYADLTKGLTPAGDNARHDPLLTLVQGNYQPGMLTDPKNVKDLGNGVNATYWGNLSPLGQRDDTSANWFHDMGPGLMIAAALLTAGAASEGLLGAGAAGGSGAAGVSGSSALATGGFGTDIAAGSAAFDGAAGAAAAGGAAGGTSGAGTTWNGDFGSGGLDPETASGQYGGMGDVANGGTYAGPPSGFPNANYAPVEEHSVIGNQAQVIDHSVPATGPYNSTNPTGLLGQAGQWALDHPIQAAGLLQTGYGLIHGGSKTGGSSSGGGNKGGNGNTGTGNFSMPQQQFYVNPYIAAQIQRGYGR